MSNKKIRRVFVLSFIGVLFVFCGHVVLENEVKLKLGVVIVNNGTNCCAILQAYSLQEVLKRMGHEVVLIPKPGPFVDRHNLLDTRKFDAIILGSDQVWRDEVEGSEVKNITSMLLNFLPKDSTCKKIAYAASFGVSYWNFSPQQMAQFEALTKQFDAISVREDSAVTLCRDYLRVKASHVLDPTMLLETQDYIQHLNMTNSTPSEGQILVYFVWGITADKNVTIDRVGCNRSRIPVFVNTQGKNREFCAKQWLRGFYDADFIVTDSFHGCVFSIIFNKPFIVYGYKLGWIASLTSLLKILGLEKQLILSSNELTKELLEANIDWVKVNERLQSLKTKSEDFLFNALKFRQNKNEKKILRGKKKEKNLSKKKE